MQDPSELLIRRMAGRVLATHSEAQSLLSEAGHCRALADQSAAEMSRRYGVMQAARIGYEELRHRLDPRRRRPIHFGVAMALLTGLFAVLVVLDVITFDGVLAGWVSAAAVAAAAAWTGCAWLAALALREGERGRLTAVTAGAVTMGALLAALHGASPNGAGPNGAGPNGASLHGTAATTVPTAEPWSRFGVGAVAVLLVLALVAVAAVLIARTEPASLLIARRHWNHCRSGYAAAVRIHRDDTEAEAVARQGWRSLIQANVTDDRIG